MKEFSFSKGNRKISKDVLIWNLPRAITCRGAGECLRFCYEIKIERMYPNVRKSRMRNLEFSKKKEFVKKIVEYLKRRKEKIIRLHESGDLYSQEYLDKWKEIARQLPEKRFFAYTKSFDLDLWTNLPPNFNIIQSYGSRFDFLIDKKKATARVIKDVRERKPFEFICPEQLAKKKGKEIKCMRECKLCLRKNIHVAFLLH